MNFRSLSAWAVSIFVLAGASNGAAEEGPEFRQHPFLQFDAEQNYSADVALLDADDDGDLDVLVANGRHWAQQDFLFLNTGEGKLLEAFALGNSRSASYTMQAGDLDGDGDQDAVVIRDLLPALILNNDGSGRLSVAGEVPSSAGPSRSAVLFDMNDDGALDLAVVTRRGADRLYRGNGQGGFYEGVDLPGEGYGSTGIVAGDIDSDEDIDLVIARRDGTPSVIMSNDGTGDFIAASIPDSKGDHRKVALADFDRDGKQDIALVSPLGRHSIYERDEDDQFQRTSSFGQEGEAVQALAAGDIDKDGDIDMVAGADGPNALYLNDGTGRFERQVIPSDADTYGVALGDMNGDGLLDLVFANSGAMNEVVLSRKPSASQKPKNSDVSLSALS